MSSTLASRHDQSVDLIGATTSTYPIDRQLAAVPRRRRRTKGLLSGLGRFGIIRRLRVLGRPTAG